MHMMGLRLLLLVATVFLQNIAGAQSCSTLDASGTFGRSNDGIAFGLRANEDVYLTGLETLVYTDGPGQGSTVRSPYRASLWGLK